MGVFGYKTFSSLYDFYRLLRKREIDDVPGIISAGAAPTAVEEHSSDFVDRNPFILLDLFEVGWRETRLFFELPGKVLLAAVIEHVSDLCEVLLSVDDQLFGSLHFLKNPTPRDRLSLYIRKQSSQILMLFLCLFSLRIGELALQPPFIAHLLNSQLFHRLYYLSCRTIHAPKAVVVS